MTSATFLPADPIDDVPRRVRAEELLAGSAGERPPGQRPVLRAIPITRPVPATGPRLRRRPIPVREPLAMRTVDEPDTGPGIAPTQGTLALSFSPPFRATPAPPHLGPDPVTPEQRDWALRFVVAAVEVAIGIRSPAQLVRWTSLEVHGLLTRRGALAARARGTAGYRGGAPAIRALRICVPVDGVQEVSAVVSAGDRVRAVAFRMEDASGRWRVTALEVG